jgi:peptidoglycan/xylan/chitin deacetylase (PgdA/CDA1 family)
MNTDIAVVITCHELGRTIREAVDSVLWQTRRAAEVVVIDDGSTDVLTRQVLHRLAADGVRVISTPNRGVSFARNLGARSTASPYLVFLDGDDRLERDYFDRAGARLDGDVTLAFVSCGMRMFGAAEGTWIPPSPRLEHALVRPTLHVSTMMRREVWESVGGFDESFPCYEEMDFWASVLERGYRGEVIAEPLLNYRVRPASMARGALRQATFQAVMDRFYRKHFPASRDRMTDVLLEVDRFLLEQREHQERLLSARRDVETRLGELDARIQEAGGILEARSRARVDWGDLRRTTPVSPLWGLERGRPLDRYYIERFLGQHRQDIRGRVLEIKDAGYTEMFGEDRVTRADVLDIDPANPAATTVADLARADAIADDTYDCVILTQTLGVIFDHRAALAETFRILRPGGVLLCTVPATGRIDEELGLDRDYWRFTEASVRRLFAEVFPVGAFDVAGHGNVLAAAAFLYGLASHELTVGELDDTDPYFPVVYTVRAVKPADGRTANSVSGREPRRQATHHAILMYHRIASLESDRFGLAVRPEIFEGQLATLAREGFVVMPLADLVTGSDPRPPRAVALTFDDGYADALEVVADLLAGRSYPATFFVVGEALAPGFEFWWDTAERLIATPRDRPTVLRLEWAEGRRSWRTGRFDERCAALDEVAAMCRGLDAANRSEVLRQIREWAGSDHNGAVVARPLTIEQLRALASRPGVTVGAHSERHLDVPAQSDEDRTLEVAGSRRHLESVLSMPVRAFAYPYGRYDSRTIAAVREAGFDFAVSTDARSLRHPVDPLALPRLDVRSWADDDFLGRLLSAR